MRYYKSSSSASTVERFIHVNCDIEATFSERVRFSAQNVQFDEDLEGGAVRFIARAYENGYNDSKKGMFLEFSKDITSGKYAPTDSVFKSFYYFESGSNGVDTTFYEYQAESGSITVEVAENSDEKLGYIINFEIVGKDHRAEKLNMKGQAVLQVFKHTS